MAKKYAYEYGRRWHVQTPRNDIRYLVDAMHVETSSLKVVQQIEARIPQDNPAYTSVIRRECGDYTVLVHNANRKLYKQVMTGSSGNGN